MLSQIAVPLVNIVREGPREHFESPKVKLYFRTPFFLKSVLGVSEQAYRSLFSFLRVVRNSNTVFFTADPALGRLSK